MRCKHPIVICWSETDQVSIAEIPDLQGCKADGESPDQALREVLVVREMWLDVAREDGVPIPEPSGQLLVTVDE